MTESLPRSVVVTSPCACSALTSSSPVSMEEGPSTKGKVVEEQAGLPHGASTDNSDGKQHPQTPAECGISRVDSSFKFLFSLDVKFSA